MPFVSTGATHYSGIRNELTNTEFLQKGSTYIRAYLNYLYGDDIVFKHEGGTQKTDDAIILKNNNRIAGISYKHHKSGTFDWLNSSKNIPDLDNLKQSLNQYKNKYPNITAETFKENEKILRNERDDIIHNHLTHITSSMIKSILMYIYNDYSEHIIINLVSENKYLYYPKNENNFSEFIGFSDWEYYLDPNTRAKNSAKIFRKKNEEIVDTNIRLRLCLNNGLNAFFGLSSANKSSIPCLKVQQEHVDDKYIPKLSDHIFEKYNNQN